MPTSKENYLDQLNKYENKVHIGGRAWDRVRNNRGDSDLSSKLICVKRFLVASNLCFLMMGVALVTLTSWTLNSNIVDLAGQEIVIAMLSLGSLIVVIGVLGFCGAICESRLSMKVYVILLFGILIAQIVIGTLAYVVASSTESLLTSGWATASNELRVNTQNQFHCCGFQSFQETKGDPCPSDTDKPCLQAIRASLDRNITNLSIVGMATAIIEVFTLIFGIMLSRGLDAYKTQKDASKL